MKLALILLSACVAMSQQQYFRDARMMFGLPWLLMPLQQELTFDDNVASNEDNVYRGMLASHGGRNTINEEEEEGFADTQSRVKGFNRYRPRPHLNNDQLNARFLFNLLASTATSFTNPLLKTATFTSMQVLTLTSLVRCVPQAQVVAGAPACRRKREHESFQYENDDNQFMIVPSKTLEMEPTDLISTGRNSEQLWSSKDDVTSGKMLSTDYNSREKRFLFVNRNQFVVSSTITTYSFVNVTSTATVNLIAPPPVGTGPCVLPNPPIIPPVVFCIACLPPGFVICPAAAG